MAVNLLEGLLKTPEDVRKEQLLKLRETGLQNASLIGAGSTPFADWGKTTVAALPEQMNKAVRRGVGALGGISSALGAPQGVTEAINRAQYSPEELQAMQQQKVMADTDRNNLYSVKAAIEKFKAAGNTKAAMAMEQRLEQLQQRNLDRERQARLDKLEADKFAQQTKYQNAMVENQAAQLGFNKQKWADEADTRKVALQTAQNTLNNARSTEAGFAEIAGNPSALSGLGFSDKQVMSIADSENKAGWYPMIKARMEALVAAENGGGLGGVEGEKARILDAEIAKLNALKEGTPEWNTQNNKVAQYAEMWGANQTKTIEDRQKVNAEAAQGASTANAKIDQVMTFINQNADNMKTGLSATAADYFAKLTGTQGPEQYVRTVVNGIINSNIINDLPPGVASDKDVELVLKGAPPANADPAVLKQYLEGVRKINEYKLKEQARYSKYVSDARNQINPHGYDNWRFTQLQNERKDWLIKNGFEAAANNPDNLTGSGFFKIASGVVTTAQQLDKTAAGLRARLEGVK
jgi:hypothetical protein